MKRTILIALTMLTWGLSLPAEEPPMSRCSAPEYRQFDFWIGNWRVETPDGKLAGHNRITSIHDGCGLREEWTGAGPSRGGSLNIYDAIRGVWHQTWIDNGGLLLTIEGGLRDGRMVLEGARRNQDGDEISERITWTPLERGNVEQRWEQSTDGGETWKVVFLGIYKRE